MRTTLLFACLLALPAAAGEEKLELLRLKRVAMQAQMKIASIHARKGELDAALAAYQDALRLHAGVVGGARGPTIDLALKWLAKHQDKDGKWDADQFMKHDVGAGRCDGPGNQNHDIGVTSLALLAFLRAGDTGKNVRSGLDYLLRSQDATGVFGPRANQHFVYGSTIATIAMCEAAARTHDERYLAAARRGIGYIHKARNPFMGWRYGPRGGENDTSVTAWCVAALDAAKAAKIEVDPETFKGASAWIEKMTDPNFGQVGYNMRGGAPARMEGMQDKFPPERSQSMTAAGLFVRLAAGENPRKSEAMQKGAKLCLDLVPNWNPDAGSIDMYYWYYGTLAMARIGGHEFKKWNEHLTHALRMGQRKKGAATGSWDPVGAWGTEGGRVYATAIGALALQESMARRARRAGPR